MGISTRVNGKYNENDKYTSKGDGRIFEEIWKVEVYNKQS